MAVAVTSVDICNMALSHLGVKEIQSLDEESDAAIACKFWYDKVFQDLLFSVSWNWATVWTQLQTVQVNQDLWPDTTAVWGFIYRLPSDCLFFRRIWNGQFTDDKYNFVPYVLGTDGQGGLIFTNYGDNNTPPGWLPIGQYTSLNPQLGVMPPDFKMGFSLMLAAWLSTKITQGNQMKRMELLQLAGVKMQDAISRDANQVMPPMDFISNFQKARSNRTVSVALQPGGWIAQPSNFTP